MKCWITVGLVVLAGPLAAPAQAPTAEQKQATVAWIGACRKDNGGFAADKGPKTPATLRATTTAVRALRYFGGELANKKGCVRFVESCYDKVDTGFGPVPGGKANAITTAVGLLAVVDLGIQAEEYRVKPVIYLCAKAKKFEEWRLAAAAYEAIKARCELSADWIVAIERKHGPDGLYGKDGGVARDTANAVVTILRLGGNVEKRANVLRVLKAGQRADGAWGKAGDGSDLETTYHVVRAFVMLKARPRDVPACRDFIARCRHKDGSYGVQPGQAGSMAATYFAGIVLHWLEERK